MKRGTKPLISVVVPALNEEAYLGACLASLRAQKVSVPFEIIVADNGSTDRTAAIARGYGAKVVKAPTRGVCHARQAGTLAAKGEIVVSTDADTTYSPKWLARIYSEFQKRPNAAIIAGPCRFVDAPKWIFLYEWLLAATLKIYKHFGYLWYAFAANLAFRKEAWEKVGGYNVALTQGGDELNLINRMRAVGEVVGVPDNPVFTSSRRLNRGFLYMLGVTLTYYFGDYGLSKLAGKSVLGSYAEVRTEKPSRWTLAGSYAAYLLAVLAISHAALTHTALARTRAAKAMRGDLTKIRSGLHYKRA